MDPMALKDAMKRRRGQGVDIKLIIDGEPHDVVPSAPSEEAMMAQSGLGNDEDPEEQKLEDLAPEVKDAPGEKVVDEEEQGMDDSALPMRRKIMAMKGMKKSV